MPVFLHVHLSVLVPVSVRRGEQKSVAALLLKFNVTIHLAVLQSAHK